MPCNYLLIGSYLLWLVTPFLNLNQLCAWPGRLCVPDARFAFFVHVLSEGLRCEARSQLVIGLASPHFAHSVPDSVSQREVTRFVAAGFHVALRRDYHRIPRKETSSLFLD